MVAGGFNSSTLEGPGSSRTGNYAQRIPELDLCNRETMSQKKKINFNFQKDKVNT